MGARDDVVRAQWRELLPTAYLLTGDQGTARQLVVRTLARQRGRTVDRDGALAALVRTHRRRWRITGRAGIQETPTTPWWSSPEDTAAALQLAAVLDLLDRDERTAVVLRWFEDRSPEQVAELVPGADPDAAAGRLPVDPAQLPRRLEGLAALCDIGSLDDDDVAAAVRETAGRRTRRAVLAVGAVAALVAAGTWLPGAVPAPGADTARPTATTPTTTPLRGLLALPPRGSLAGVDGLLDQLRQRLTELGTPGDDHRLLYADDVDGLRIVLMARPGASEVDLAWLTGPARTAPAALDVAQGGYAGPGAETAVAVSVPGGDGRGTRVLVLVEDGDVVRVSAGVDVDPVTGATGRSWVDLPAPDGVATTTLDRTSDAGIRLLVGPPGDLREDVWPTSTGSSFLWPSSSPVPPSRSGSPTASPIAYEAALSTVVLATGWAEDDLDVVVLGAGTVPTAAGGTMDVVSIAAVLPDGAVVTTTGTGSDTTSSDGSTVTTMGGCGSTGHPAGTDVDSLVVAAICLDSGEAYTRTAVVAAPAGTRVVLGFPSGSATMEPELVDGFGWTTFLAREDPRTATAGTVTYAVAGAGNDDLQQ